MKTYKEIKLDNLLTEINSFYDYKTHHFVCMNANNLGENQLKLQWIFSLYGLLDEYYVLWAMSDFTSNIPSITHIIPSAIMSEAEIVDLFGVNIEGIKGGLYLDETSPTAPLGCAL